MYHFGAYSPLGKLSTVAEDRSMAAEWDESAWGGAADPTWPTLARPSQRVPVPRLVKRGSFYDSMLYL